MSDLANSESASCREPRLIELETTLGMDSIGELYQALLEHSGSGGAVVIEGGGVSAVDTASLQLLCSFVLAGKTEGFDVSWRGISDVLRKAIALTALQEALSLE